MRGRMTLHSPFELSPDSLSTQHRSKTEQTNNDSHEEQKEEERIDKTAKVAMEEQETSCQIGT